jgi:hypothetical protein
MSHDFIFVEPVISTPEFSGIIPMLLSFLLAPHDDKALKALFSRD